MLRERSKSILISSFGGEGSDFEGLPLILEFPHLKSDTKRRRRRRIGADRITAHTAIRRIILFTHLWDNARCQSLQSFTPIRIEYN
jgi:hypothetical protein